MLKPIGNLWPNAALAFRGYNTENLGRTAELLAVAAYEPIITARMEQASRVCGGVLGRPVDLLARVRAGREATLDDYAEAVALVFATEAAQLDLLDVVHGVDPLTAEMSFGYSLGELVAMASSGLIDDEQALRIPLAMASDCARLAGDVTMGILFSRQAPIDEHAAAALCEEITAESAGVIALSAVLSPNSLLLLGQSGTIEAFRERMRGVFGKQIHMRLNDSRWPPLHTPIVWQQNIADRASVMIQQLRVSPDPPRPPVLSLVSGKPVACGEVRRLLRDWVDHPQRLWDAVTAVLRSPAETVVHVGPAPNVIPATFERLSENIKQIRDAGGLYGFGARTLGEIVDRRWLTSRLPASAALLRAPALKHVVLEDWLIENAPAK